MSYRDGAAEVDVAVAGCEGAYLGIAVFGQACGVCPNMWNGLVDFFIWLFICFSAYLVT